MIHLFVENHDTMCYACGRCTVGVLGISPITHFSKKSEQICINLLQTVNERHHLF